MGMEPFPKTGGCYTSGCFLLVAAKEMILVVLAAPSVGHNSRGRISFPPLPLTEKLLNQYLSFFAHGDLVHYTFIRSYLSGIHQLQIEQVKCPCWNK